MIVVCLCCLYSFPISKYRQLQLHFLIVLHYPEHSIVHSSARIVSLAPASARITPEKTITPQDYQWQLWTVTYCQDTPRKTITITSLSNFLGLSVATVSGVCVVSCQIGKDRHTFTGKLMKPMYMVVVGNWSFWATLVTSQCLGMLFAFLSMNGTS